MRAVGGDDESTVGDDVVADSNWSQVHVRCRRDGLRSRNCFVRVSRPTRQWHTQCCVKKQKAVNRATLCAFATVWYLTTTFEITSGHPVVRRVVRLRRIHEMRAVAIDNHWVCLLVCRSCQTVAHVCITGMAAFYKRGRQATCWSICTTCCSTRLLQNWRSQAVLTGCWHGRHFFTNILNNPYHVLHNLLPDKTDHTYNVRPRRHSLSLSVETDYSNFINRQLFKDIYYSLIYLVVAFCHLYF